MVFRGRRRSRWLAANHAFDAGEAISVAARFRLDRQEIPPGFSRFLVYPGFRRVWVERCRKGPAGDVMINAYDAWGPAEQALGGI